MKSYPDSWEGLAHGKPPLHSDGSFSGARHLPAEDAKVSKITQRSHLSVQQRDNNQGRIFRPAAPPAAISESLFLDQGNKQKDSTLLFRGGRMKGWRERTAGVGNLESHWNRDCNFFPISRVIFLSLGIKPEMQNKFGHPIADKKRPRSLQEPSL